MANRLATGADWLDRKLRASASEEVTYRRGDQTINLPARKLHPRAETEGGDVVTIEAQAPDWIISRADLVLGGRLAEPAEGDRIEHPIGSETWIYEVMPTRTESAAEPADPYGKAWRIHSRLVEVR